MKLVGAPAKRATSAGSGRAIARAIVSGGGSSIIAFLLLRFLHGPARREPNRCPAAPLGRGLAASLRALLDWSARLQKIMRRIDHRQMRKRLGEIAKLPLADRIVFLRQQPDVVAQGHQALEQRPRFVAPP